VRHDTPGRNVVMMSQSSRLGRSTAQGNGALDKGPNQLWCRISRRQKCELGAAQTREHGKVDGVNRATLAALHTLVVVVRRKSSGVSSSSKHGCHALFALVAVVILQRWSRRRGKGRASQLDIKTSSGHGGMGSKGAGRSRLLLAVAVTAEHERIARNR